MGKNVTLVPVNFNEDHIVDHFLNYYKDETIFPVLNTGLRNITRRIVTAVGGYFIFSGTEEIGFVLLHESMDHERTVEIDMGILSDRAHQGYGTEALLQVTRLLIEQGFNVLGEISITNIASQKLIEKLNFKIISNEGNIIKAVLSSLPLNNNQTDSKMKVIYHS